jgi:hypothetical protein
MWFQLVYGMMIIEGMPLRRTKTLRERRKNLIKEVKRRNV